jgi:hypothetical protein
MRKFIAAAASTAMLVSGLLFAAPPSSAASLTCGFTAVSYTVGDTATVIWNLGDLIDPTDPSAFWLGYVSAYAPSGGTIWTHRVDSSTGSTGSATVDINDPGTYRVECSRSAGALVFDKGTATALATPPVITPAITPLTQTVVATAGSPITPTAAFTAVGFTGPFQYTISSRPPDLPFDSITGVMSGTQMTAGTWNVGVEAINPTGTEVANATITVIIVDLPAPVIEGVPTVPAGGLLTVNYSIPQPQDRVLGIEYQLGSGPWLRPGGTVPNASSGATFTVAGVTGQSTTVTLRSVSIDTPPIFKVGAPAPVTFATAPTKPAPGGGGPTASVPATAGGPVPSGTSNGAGSGTEGAPAATTGNAGIDAPCLAAAGTLYPNQRSTVGSQLTMAPNTHRMAKVASFEVVQGSLAPGTMLDRTVGVISGVTNQPGTYTTTIKATFLNGKTKTETFATRVDANPISLQYAARNIGIVAAPITIAPSTNAAAQGTAYTIVCGVLPQGTSFDASTGTISGKPTRAVLKPTPLRVAQSSATGSSAASFIFVVSAAGVPTISYPANPHARKGHRATIRPTIVEKTSITSYQVIKGKLPRGLHLNRHTGTIKGRPARTGPTHTITIMASRTTGAPLLSNSMRITVRR